jgi:hypothetical protein
VPCCPGDTTTVNALLDTLRNGLGAPLDGGQRAAILAALAPDTAPAGGTAAWTAAHSIAVTPRGHTLWQVCRGVQRRQAPNLRAPGDPYRPAAGIPASALDTQHRHFGTAPSAAVILLALADAQADAGGSP